MKKISKLREPDEEKKYIFIEGIDYLKTDKVSIWGQGDKDTLDFLEKTEICGKWLNLAAGDGRYHFNLIKMQDLWLLRISMKVLS